MPALLEVASELLGLGTIRGNGPWPVEANDMGAVNLMRGRPFVGGHSVRVYKDRTLSLLARRGCIDYPDSPFAIRLVQKFGLPGNNGHTFTGAASGL